MRLLTVVTFAALLLVSSTTVAGEDSYWVREMKRVILNAADDYMRYVESWGNVTILPSGMGMNILQRGHGDVAPGPNDSCLIRYTGMYRFPGVFEDTRQYPFPVRRTPSQMIQGVGEALQYMREGDRWFLYVPYRLAYGREGNATLKIQPYMNLRYDLEVVSCDAPSGKKSAEIDAFLEPLLKRPMPSKTPKIDWEKL
ncbi:peptidyl-prolyl cis-trans isomerase, macrophage infectivity potentiator precursor [Angomonas deanei]|nr:peptidyl-prolyl cis-trans isomerase, macrophage infectivity potentiator precursor [Angomonas deanei]|eukprot:EPY41632.1 peptidyl-prolyl cis-trans isomerase, macrophage infectivity potentiator precursor [Angomonas deanei]